MAVLTPSDQDLSPDDTTPVGVLGNRGSAPLPTVLVPADIRPPWRVVFGALLIGVVCTIFGAQGGFVVESLKPEVWQASAEIEFRRQSQFPETVALTFESPNIWAPVAANHGYTQEEFQKWFSVEVAGGTQIIRVQFADTDEDKARQVVDEIVTNYFVRFPVSTPTEQISLLEARRATLEEIEASLIKTLENRQTFSREVQVDYQNQLTRTQGQITDLLVQQEALRLQGERESDIDPVILTRSETLEGRSTFSYVGEEPIAPSPVKGLIFGGAAGGLIGLVAVYLAMHRSAMPGLPLEAEEAF